MREIICEYCGNKVFKKAWNAKTCSSYCSLKNWRKNNPEHNRQIKRNWRRKNGVLEFGSIEHRNKISLILKGTILSDNTKKKMVGSALRGERHHAWKGNKVGYRPLHLWVERQLGKANYCSNNKSHISTRYHWANISGEYKRDVSDWRQLCPKCNMNDNIHINSRFL